MSGCSKKKSDVRDWRIRTATLHGPHWMNRQREAPPPPPPPAPPLSVDTELDNYSVKEILQLFKMPMDFDNADMQRARRTAQRMHPDVSRLPPKYFEFFQKAYRMLERLHDAREFREHKAAEMQQQGGRDRLGVLSVSSREDEQRSSFAAEMSKRKDFGEWFNGMFAKTRPSDTQEDTGYEKWLRAEACDAAPTVRKMDQLNEYFEKEKAAAAAKYLARYRGVREMGGGGHYELDRYSEPEYSSGVFDKLAYQDLKLAHTENMIPVCTSDALAQRKQYASVEEYRNSRDAQNLTPASESDSRRQLAEISRGRDDVDMTRTFNMMQQDETNRKKNEEWWSLARGIK